MPENFSVDTLTPKNTMEKPSMLFEFSKENSTNIDIWGKKQLSACSKDNTNVDGFTHGYVCEPDKTRVALPKALPQKIDSPAKKALDKDKAKDKPKPKDGMTDYLNNSKDYKSSNTKKYNKVLSYVNKKVKGERGTAITNMVCKMSDKYGIDPEITATLLDHETGGFVFDKRTMDPENKKYKGVMQVNLGTIECMYADGDAWKKMKTVDKNYAYSYDHRHYTADQKRIDELKKIYPTPNDLYNAMKTDVELGLEVGIIAYKGKLSRTNGNVKEAIKQYNGGQYTANKDCTAPEKIWPLPKYEETNQNIT